MNYISFYYRGGVIELSIAAFSMAETRVLFDIDGAGVKVLQSKIMGNFGLFHTDLTGSAR